MKDDILIKIEQSDRYNKGEIGFLKCCNMDYVQKYTEVTGEEKEKYIAKKENQNKEFWEKELEKDFLKFKTTLGIASNYIDVSKYKIKGVI